MGTLKDLIDALIIITELVLTGRFILCCIKESNQEDQPQLYKKKKQTVLVALIAIVCVYDIPRIIQNYFGETGL